MKIPAAIRGSVDGLMVIDSLGGESLAERFGQTSGWEHFVLYRAAPRNVNLTVTFALSGFGEALIDNVSITPLVSVSATADGRANLLDGRASLPASRSLNNNALTAPAAQQALRLQSAFGTPRR